MPALPYPGTAQRGGLEVRPVERGPDLRAFIDLPWRVYADDPHWVPPLRLERRLHFSRANPFFEHGRWQAWLALRGGVPVGRISAQTDRLHRRRYGDHTGHIGLLEGMPDAEVFAALLETAEAWLHGRGARTVTGPFGLSINQECGVLVEGFETPPSIMMPHGRPWYEEMLLNQGYIPVKDLLAYWVETDFTAPPVMERLLRRHGPRVKMRRLRRPELAGELEILRDIFNDAWSENWGFVPMTRSEFADLGASLRLFVPDEFVQIAEIDGEPVAFIVALPNLNEVLPALNGRLLPFGLPRLLWRVRRRRIRTGRVPLMGVRKHLQNTPLGMALAFLTIGEVRKHVAAAGIGAVEMSWILDDNRGMRSILDSIGSSMYKRYRLFEKTLAPQGEGA